MKVSDLIKELQSCDPTLDIDVVVSITEHKCGPNSYCYCSSEDKQFEIGGIMRNVTYDKKSKKQIVTALSISTFD